MPLLNNLFFEIRNGIIVASIKDFTYIYNISITNNYKNIIISWDPIIITGFVTNYIINCIQGNLGSKSTTLNSIIFPNATSETTYLFTITPIIDGINGSTTYTKTYTTSLFSIATGGNSIYTANVGLIPYKFHKFTSTTSSTFTVNTDINAYMLVVGGGGSGGSINNASESGGGGGGGEVFYTETVLLKSGTTCNITVGATSTVGSGSNQNFNGNSSRCVVRDKDSNILIDIIATGGSYGGGSYGGVTMISGSPGTGSGSGGGGCGINNNVNGSYGTISSYTNVDSTFKDKYYNLANNGASGIHVGIPYSNNTQGGAGGGGGGAGGGGSICTYPNGFNNVGGNGGSSYLWIDSNYYGGGGSGGASMVIYGTNRIGSAGDPGINAGKGGDYGSNGNPGSSNFGGGGGGCSSGIVGGSGGAGGSGVVIIAYPV